MKMMTPTMNPERLEEDEEVSDFGVDVKVVEAMVLCVAIDCMCRMVKIMI